MGALMAIVGIPTRGLARVSNIMLNVQNPTWCIASFIDLLGKSCQGSKFDSHQHTRQCWDAVMALLESVKERKRSGMPQSFTKGLLRSFLGGMLADRTQRRQLAADICDCDWTALCSTPCFTNSCLDKRPRLSAWQSQNSCMWAHTPISRTSPHPNHFSCLAGQKFLLHCVLVVSGGRLLPINT